MVPSHTLSNKAPAAQRPRKIYPSMSELAALRIPISCGAASIAVKNITGQPMSQPEKHHSRCLRAFHCSLYEVILLNEVAAIGGER